jgi:hypothetical protein
VRNEKFTFLRHFNILGDDVLSSRVEWRMSSSEIFHWIYMNFIINFHEKFILLWEKFILLWEKFILLWEKFMFLWEKFILLWEKFICIWKKIIFLSMRKKSYFYEKKIKHIKTTIQSDGRSLMQIYCPTRIWRWKAFHWKF